MGESKVVLRFSRFNEVLSVLSYALLAGICGLVLLNGGYDLIAREWGGGWLKIWAIRVAVALIVCSFAASGLCAAWRLFDRRPLVEADRAGLRLHPSLHAPEVAWADVARVVVSLGHLEIVFRRRFWSLTSWATARRVRLRLGLLTLNGEDSREAVRRLEKWRAA